jgi:hypothetical protein
MKFITRRADASPACWRAPDNRPEHSVEPNAAGWFDVTSARSGSIYRVSTSGECTCPGYTHLGRCSHLAAVMKFAADVLGGLKEGERDGDA